MAATPERILYLKLKSARSYNEWKEYARQLDILVGNDAWRNDPVSSDYDHRLIASRLQHLREARANGDISAIIYRLRAGLIRNLGGICDMKLFTRSLLGTKHLIENYTQEVVSQLEFIQHGKFEGFSESAKIEFFADTRQSFGNTALLLHGGATFGLYHLGVVKCLYEHGLLPRIISGTSIGALIAALVGTRTEDELPNIFTSNGINLQAFARVGKKGSLQRKMMRLIQHGYLMDVTVLEDCVRSNIGDVTFEEAFKKTKRILNIVVSSARTNEVPRLLNYLTAPNVLISSAACASCAITGLYDSVPLLAKDNSGNIVRWNPESNPLLQSDAISRLNLAIKWSDASMDNEAPTSRLAELFNVNHVIMSQANPYLLPFAPRGNPLYFHKSQLFMGKVINIVTGELKHRLFQMNELGLLPKWLKGFSDSKVAGNVTIYPDIAFTDYHILFSNPTSNTLDHWMLKGEQATWPLLALIRNRCAIELALDRLLLYLRSRRRLLLTK